MMNDKKMSEVFELPLLIVNTQFWDSLIDKTGNVILSEHSQSRREEFDSIVHAVNSHDQLLAENKSFKLRDAIFDDDYGSTSRLVKRKNKEIKELKAKIAELEKREKLAMDTIFNIPDDGWVKVAHHSWQCWFCKEKILSERCPIKAEHYRTCSYADSIQAYHDSKKPVAIDKDGS